MGRYDDIIGLTHHRSQVRPPMPMENRAAQFAPFAALSGHDEAVSETARLTDARIELSNEEKIAVSKSLTKAYTKGLDVAVGYFKQDKIKSGGSYAVVIGRIVKLDEYDKTITLSSGIVIGMEDIVSITFSPSSKR